MKRSIFLLISAILAFAFGSMMFLLPGLAAKSLGLASLPETSSVLRGMGGLIIGSGMINFFLRDSNDSATLGAILLTNVITHLLGLSADIWGVVDGVLTTSKIAPVETTHLFVAIGSLIYLLSIRSAARIRRKRL
jgi:hypothetical protein